MSSTNWTTNNIPNMTGKVVIITGANSGLGFESTIALTRKGAQVIMACRSKDKAQTAINQLKSQVPQAKVEFMTLDLASQNSIREFAKWFNDKYTHLDLLLNNAGIMSVPYGKTEDGFERQLGTNHLGHFALTGLLLERIKETPNARVVTMSSGAHTMASMDFNNLQYEGGNKYSASTAYGRSKLANLLFTYKLQRLFEKNNIKAMALSAHPGGANTNLNNHYSENLLGRLMMPLMNKMFQSAEMGALPILRAATDPQAQGGQYYGPNGFTGNSGYPILVKSNKKSYDHTIQNKLWDVSEQLTNIKYFK